MDHRVGEKHDGRQVPRVISDPHCRGSGQIRTCARTADRQPPRIRAEVVRGFREPTPGCMDVVERDRIVHSLRGQPVVNRYDNGSPGREFGTHYVSLRHVEITRNEGSAMQPEQTGCFPS